MPTRGCVWNFNRIAVPDWFHESHSPRSPIRVSTCEPSILSRDDAS